MTTRRFQSRWYIEELDGSLAALQNTADTREWIGSAALFALVIVILLAFGFV